MSHKHTEKRQRHTLSKTTLATPLVTDLKDSISEQVVGGWGFGWYSPTQPPNPGT